MLDAVEAPDLSLKFDIKSKDAEARHGLVTSHKQPSQKQSGGHLESRSLLSLRSLLCFKHNRHGCENLPSSSQDDITPCSSSDTSGIDAELRRSDADVCNRTIEGSICRGTTASHEITACSSSREGDSCSRGGPAVPSQRPSSFLAFCAAQAHRLKKRSTAGAARARLDHPAAVQRLTSFKVPLLQSNKGNKGRQQPNSSLPPLTLGRRPAHPKRQQRAASVFEATGRENIRWLLGPHAIWGSVTRYKMLLMAEQVHETHLQTVLSQGVEQGDWAGEPAWEDDFSVISHKYGQRVRQCLFWWGGALSIHRWRVECEEDCSGEEAAAQVAVVVPSTKHSG